MTAAVTAQIPPLSLGVLGGTGWGRGSTTFSPLAAPESLAIAVVTLLRWGSSVLLTPKCSIILLGGV